MISNVNISTYVVHYFNNIYNSTVNLANKSNQCRFLKCQGQNKDIDRASNIYFLYKVFMYKVFMYKVFIVHFYHIKGRFWGF